MPQLETGGGRAYTSRANQQAATRSTARSTIRSAKRKRYSTGTLTRRYQSSDSSSRSRSYSSSSRRRSSSGGSGRGYRATPVVANRTGRYSKPAAPPVERPGAVPKVASVNDYLGSETTYQNQLRNFSKSLADFRGDVLKRKGRVRTDFAQSDKTLREQRGTDLEGMKNDFASRGLLTSGLYGESVGDYEKQFQTQLANLLRGQTEGLGNLDTEYTNYINEQNLAKQAAREAAIRRRAANLGLG